MKTIYAEKCGKGTDDWTFKDKELVSGAYLEGKLEDKNGYDLFLMKREDIKAIAEQIKGKERCSVFLPDGEIEIADFYFWHDKNNCFRGLVTLPYDAESVKYVRKCFKKEVSDI